MSKKVTVRHANRVSGKRVEAGETIEVDDYQAERLIHTGRADETKQASKANKKG